MKPRFKTWLFVNDCPFWFKDVSCQFCFISNKNLNYYMGPAFSFRCLLSPEVKLHLYRTFVCPVLRSGLSYLVVKNTLTTLLSIFQRKVLKGVLKVSKQASTVGIHFLIGELPIEAKLHRDVFSLFYLVWINPDTKNSCYCKIPDIKLNWLF